MEISEHSAKTGDLAANVEAGLKQQWHLFDTVLSHIPDFAYTFDLDGRFTYVNAALLNLWQKPLRDAVGKDFFELAYPAELAARLQRQIREVIATKRPLRDHTPYTGAAGETGYYEYIFVPVHGPDGEVQAVAGSTRDITERNRSEEALRISEERLRFALETGGGMGTYDWDVPGDRVFADARFASLFSIDPVKAELGEPISSFIEAMHPDDRPAVSEKINQALRTGEDYLAEYRLVRRDGSLRWIHARGRCRQDSQGAPLRFTGIAFDITERKQSEDALARYAEELKRSNEDLEQFAYVASHDLRSPLNSVLNFTDLILRRQGERADEETKLLLETVRDSARRMADLIAGLLIYSRLNDPETSHQTPVSSLAAFEGATANLHSAITGAHAEIERTELPVVLSNPTQLCQVFQNLLSNAIHYRGEATPHICVAAERKGKFWQFSVIDNGPGIGARYHSLIFQPFKRLHGQEHPGSGIGLAFCRKFIERQGGAIWVESKEGEGASFRFTIPAVN